MVTTATKEAEVASLLLSHLENSPRLGLFAEMTTAQQAAAHQFEQLGLPSIRHEEWKYTSTKAFAQLAPEQLAGLVGLALSPESLHLHLPEASPYLIVYNGMPQWELSNLEGLATGISVAAFEHATGMGAKAGSLSQQHVNALDALNLASIQTGICIQAANNSLQEAPLHIIHVYNSAEAASHTRLLTHVAENAELRLAHHFVSNGADASFATLVSETWVEANARYHADVLQQATNTHLYAGWYLEQHNDSVAQYVTISTDGKWLRNNLHLVINGEHAEGNMMGLYLGHGRNLVDNHTLVDHIRPNSVSNELYKGVLNDRSTAVFNGKIFVKQAAQKTNAFQSNRNILLSDDATVNTKPQLEIFADDVKCSHGATTGALDEEPIFYLRARGLDYDQAKALLLHAFAADVLGHLKSDLLAEEAMLALENFLATEAN